MSVMCFRRLNLEASPRSLCKTSVDIRVPRTFCDPCSLRRPLAVYTAAGLVITSLGSWLKVWRCEPCFRRAHYGSQFRQSGLKVRVVGQISSSVKAILSLPFEDDTAKPQSAACKRGAVFPGVEGDLSSSVHTSWPAASTRFVRHLAKVKRTVCAPEPGIP